MITDTITQEIGARGRSLRLEIENHYHELRAAGTLQVGPNDISKVVSEYIPLGTPLREGALLLKAAGFDTDPLPPRERPLNPPPWFREEDRLSVFGRAVIDSGPSFRVICVITLSPAPDGHATLQNVSAILTFTGL
jgi:hypothetical protein